MQERDGGIVFAAVSSGVPGWVDSIILEEKEAFDLAWNDPALVSPLKWSYFGLTEQHKRMARLSVLKTGLENAKSDLRDFTAKVKNVRTQIKQINAEISDIRDWIAAGEVPQREAA